jgi:hypothetical protein
LLTEPREEARGPTGVSSLWIRVGALAVSLVALAVALLLGSLAFNYHRHLEHEELLREVVARQWTAERVTRWLEEVKGAPLLAVLESPADVEREAVTRGGRKAAEIREKARRSAQVRVYQASDMIYFIFFDDDGVMRDFTCVGA